jgi:hypothetical protein
MNQDLYINETGTVGSERKLVLYPVNAYLQSQTEQMGINSLIVWRFHSRIYIRIGWPESIEIQIRLYIYEYALPTENLSCRQLLNHRTELIRPDQKLSPLSYFFSHLFS